jgi:hypothetical protein
MESVTANLVMQLLKQGLQPLSTIPHGQIIRRGDGRDADQKSEGPSTGSVDEMRGQAGTEQVETAENAPGQRQATSEEDVAGAGTKG